MSTSEKQWGKLSIVLLHAVGYFKTIFCNIFNTMRMMWHKCSLFHMLTSVSFQLNIKIAVHKVDSMTKLRMKVEVLNGHRVLAIVASMPMQRLSKKILGRNRKMKCTWKQMHFIKKGSCVWMVVVYPTMLCLERGGWILLVGIPLFVARSIWWEQVKQYDNA